MRSIQTLSRRLAAVFASDSFITFPKLQTLSTLDFSAPQYPISLRAFTNSSMTSSTSPVSAAPWLQHHSYSTTSTTNTSTSQSEWQKQVLYRGRGIQLFRILVRFKIAQLSGVAALAVPMATFLSGGDVSTTQAVVSGALIVGSGIVSTALWYYSRRYIGEMALLTKTNPKNNTSAPAAAAIASSSISSSRSVPSLPKVRFSVLDFWGNREDVDIDVYDLVPPLKGLVPSVAAAVASEPFLPLTASGDRQYILSLRYGTVVDKELLKSLLNGSLEDRLLENKGK
jgi:hypothetical protein